jgi:DNA-binding NarL/FixJ family response regulator
MFAFIFRGSDCITFAQHWSIGTMKTQIEGISVLLATPRVMTSELMVAALRRKKHFRVVDSATTVKDVLESAQGANLDVALIAASLFDGPLSGFGALRQIRELHPDLKTVILLDNCESGLVVDAFRAGARGVFNLWRANFRSLCRCVESVHAGQIWANSKELSEVMEAFTQLAPIQVVNAEGMRLLTKREEDVVRLLAEGLQNRDIARELNLSEHTVKNYLFHIFDKLGVSSRVELILYAVSSTKRSQTADVQSERDASESGGSTINTNGGVPLSAKTPFGGRSRSRRLRSAAVAIS